MTPTNTAIRWSTNLPRSVFASPVFPAGLVVVEAYNEILAFDATSGDQRWAVKIPHTSVTAVISAQGFTVVVWCPARSNRTAIEDETADETLARLTGLDDLGNIRWQAALSTQLSSAYVLHDQVWLVGVDGGKSFLHRVAPTTGHVTTMDLTWGATQLAAHRHGLLACSAFGDVARPGLYTLSAAGVFGQALRYEPIYRVKATAEHIAIMGDGDHEDGGRLAVLDPTTFAERWATQTGSLNLALDEDLVMHTDPAQPRVVVARTATAGTEVWRSVVLDATVETLTPAGGYLFVWTDVGLVALQRTTGFVVAPPNSNTSVSAHMGRAYLAGRSLECWNPAAKP